MGKLRVSIPETVAAQILFASDNTCCKCEERGAPVQIHHIDDDPSNNEISNLAVLCLVCHHETQITGGFARQLTPAVVRLYRDAWVTRVKERRASADALALAVARAIPANKREVQHAAADRWAEDIDFYIQQIPDILHDAYASVDADWVGDTQSMIRAAYDVSEVLRRVWLRLVSNFPHGHFGEQSPEQYITNYLNSRYAWHRSMAEPSGVGMGGTITGVLVARGVLRDLETAVLDTRDSLMGLGESAPERDAWMARWNTAIERRRGSPDATAGQSVYESKRTSERTGGAVDDSDRARLETLAEEAVLFDYVLSGTIVRIVATQLLNTTFGPTAYAVSVRTPGRGDAIFDKIEGHHLTMFDEDLDGDGIPEIVVQYHCGAHTLVLNVYRLRDPTGIPELIPGATIGSDWPEIHWDRRENGKGFRITAKHRNWSELPNQEFILEQYAFENGKCLKLT